MTADQDRIDDTVDFWREVKSTAFVNGFAEGFAIGRGVKNKDYPPVRMFLMLTIGNTVTTIIRIVLGQDVGRSLYIAGVCELLFLAVIGAMSIISDLRSRRSL